MKFKVTSLFNPKNIMRAWRYKKAQQQYDRSAYDLELYLYSKILQNDMLHYGYFEDVNINPVDISIRMMEEAQVVYAQNIIAEITSPGSTVLDAGCGMGGLSGMLHQRGFKVDALTPNDNQIMHLERQYPEVKRHHCKYENLPNNFRYNTIINSESLQYINLEMAFSKSEALLEPNGRWIITDYFRKSDSGMNQSGHLVDDFRKMIESKQWRVVKERDITTNILPTLHLIQFYIDRFGLPLKHFGLEKFKFKKPFLYSLSDDARNSLNNKVEKELSAVDPIKFEQEKQYMFFVLEKV